MDEHFVNMRLSDCLKMSNMLRENMNKLRLNVSDEVGRICFERIPEWKPAIIEKMENRDTNINFKMRTRFLLGGDGKVTFCPASMCPVPPMLTAGKSDEILVRYKPPEAAWKVIVDLFE